MRGDEYAATISASLRAFAGGQDPDSPAVMDAVRNIEVEVEDGRKLLEELQARLGKLMAPSPPEANERHQGPTRPLSPLAEQLFGLAGMASANNRILRSVLGRMQV